MNKLSHLRPDTIYLIDFRGSGCYCPWIMEAGTIIEYIDNQKIICAVVLEIKNQRLRLLTENNREVKMSEKRISHYGNSRIGVNVGRNTIVDTLKETAQRRKNLKECIDIKELWEVLASEEEWIDLDTMTGFCFPDSPTADHEAAVLRAFFENRTYFKFNFNRFFPYSEEQVEQIIAKANEAERTNQLIVRGSEWMTNNLKEPKNNSSPDAQAFIDILSSYYLFENESPHARIAKEILTQAQIDSPALIFKLLVQLGVWDKNENLNLHRYQVPVDFPEQVLREAERLVGRPVQSINAYEKRRDLTELPLMTIDGSQTLDFDDALSIEKDGENYRIGVHIIDVGHFIQKGSALDQEALNRASSIYMPDQRIPMLPNSLAEDLCSLKVGEIRPAITIFAKVNAFAELIDYEVIASVIKVERQLTYFDANMMIDADEELKALYHLARLFRRKRLSSGAIQINIPEINIWFTEDGAVSIGKTERESPGRILVAEMMIMANWLMAMFLSKREVPAVFRSQADPKNRLKMDEEGTLFQNWMQRKFLSRAIIGTKAEFHSGLGLNAYLTATSPIRKYFDLVVQRQIRGVLGLDALYSGKEVRDIIQMVEIPMSQVMRVQFLRHRFWILKYLEGRKGKKEEAILLDKRRSNYTILLTEYVIECKLPLSSGMRLKPGDVIQVTIQHVNAHQDTLSVYLG